MTLLLQVAQDRFLGEISHFMFVFQQGITDIKVEENDDGSIIHLVSMSYIQSALTWLQTRVLEAGLVGLVG